MAWYTTGTVNIASTSGGASAVTGVGTDFVAAGIKAGDALLYNNALYEVLANPASATSLSIRTSGFVGVTGVTYAIVPTQAIVRDLTGQVTALINDYSGAKTYFNEDGTAKVVDGTVADPSYAFSSDTDTGFYRIGSNAIGIAANGQKQAEVNATDGIVVVDDKLTVVDGSDATKRARFETSGITTGTTRTFALPNASTTLVGTDTTQTLTNKTLTSPDINGGTWNGTIDGNWTAASQTCANLGSVTTADINGGTIDGTTIGGSTAAAGTFTTLNTTGNVTLGDASTDTVTVNGRMGFGGGSSVTTPVYVSGSLSAGAGITQIGVYSTLTGTTEGTNAVYSFFSYPRTAAASYTVSHVAGIFANDAVKGAGSTITNQHGVYVPDQTQGTNNYGITSIVSSGANKWNIYASGTAANYFAGNVGIGTNAPSAQLDVFNIVQTHNNAAMNDSRVGEFQFRNTNGNTSTNPIRASIYAGRQPNDWGAYLTFRTSTGTAEQAERLRIDSSGNTIQTQPAPAAVNTTATLITSNLRTRIITSTTAALVTGTLPTGTLMDSGLFNGAADMGYDWSVINTGGTNNFVVAAGADHTVVGNMTVSPNTTGMFRSRRTTTNTWITYRVG